MILSKVQEAEMQFVRENGVRGRSTQKILGKGTSWEKNTWSHKNMKVVDIRQGTPVSLHLSGAEGRKGGLSQMRRQLSHLFSSLCLSLLVPGSHFPMGPPTGLRAKTVFTSI